MAYENLKVDASSGVVRITIDRPKVLNALNRATMIELDRAIEALDPSARVVVITGGGEKAFVAGADISEMATLGSVLASEFARAGQRTLMKLEALPQPVIAEVNGFALGGGCELMLACDFAIASDKARFGQPEVGLGVTPGFGGSVRLGRRIGTGMARQLLYSGEQIKAEEALRIGLVNEVVPAEKLRARVDELAARIIKNAPLAVALTKRSAHLGEESELAAACDFEAQVFGATFSTEDQKEGMRAFLEKRAAAWKGQ
jgi:enoyl-CoA hydratase